MSHDADLDELLRRALQRHPAPACAATLADDIVRQVINCQTAQRQCRRRALLIGYWIAVAVGSWWLLQSLPLPVWALPTWTPESLSPAWAWWVPCAGALLVWRRPIARYIHSLGAQQ